MPAARWPVAGAVAGSLAAAWRRSPLPARLLYGGLVVASLASFLPWMTVDVLGAERNLGPSDVGRLAYQLVVAALVALAGWPAFGGTMSRLRWGVVVATMAVLSLFPIGWFTTLGDKEGALAQSGVPGIFDPADIQMSAGIGLYLFVCALAVAWSGVILILLARRRSAAPSTFAPPAVWQ